MEVRFEDQGMITCRAENVFGVRVAQVKLIVFGELLFTFCYFHEITFQESLRTVPTFVSAHTFCASRKPWFTRHARTRVEIDVINYATKCATKMKAKFSYCDQIKFNEPVLKSETPE